MKELYWWAIISLLFAVFMAFTYEGWARVEGEVRPVVADVELSEARHVPDEGWLVWFTFEKARGCQFEGLAFYGGQRDERFARLSVDLDPDESDVSSGIDQSRPAGKQKAGPWLVRSPKEQGPETWFADVRHRCHPLWLTRTRFWN
jgi:hypothetical protein